VPEVEEQLVSEVEGQSEVPSEDIYKVTPNSKKNFLEGKKMTLNAGDDLSVNLEEFDISATDDETALQGYPPQDKSDTVDNPSGACDIKVQNIEKCKYVCSECEELFTNEGF
jgi:hypothetical protein